MVEHLRSLSEYELSLEATKAEQAGDNQRLAEITAERTRRHRPNGSAMSTGAIVGWSLVLAAPAQFAFFLILGVDLTSGSFICRGFHEGGLSSCSFEHMLSNVLTTLVLTNVLSYGLFFVISACLIAFLLFSARAVRRTARAQNAKDDSRQA
jgi:Flp pilus assembly protein TadB